jgi:hypothetical protein
MAAVAFDRLEWRPALMPGANSAARLAPLPRADDGAYRAFVWFPAGWTRSESGHYAEAEEFLILAGDLGLDSSIWRAGGYAWLPANCVRSRSRSESGCLAFAWFSSAPSWIPGEPAARARAGVVRFAHWREAPVRSLPGNVCAHELYRGPEHESWVIERRHVGLLVAPGSNCETLALHDRSWRIDEASGPCESPSEAVFLRRVNLPATI